MPFLKVLRSEIIDHRQKTTNLDPQSSLARRGSQGTVYELRTQYCKPAGFTLIEIVISLFIIIAIITILLTTSSVQLASRGSNLQGVAVKIASRQIETLRKTDFSLLPQSGPFADPDLAKLPQSSAQRTIGDYQSDEDIKVVTIQVTWVVGGAAKETKLETLIYKNGL